eukprot:1192384-Prorocentrum_minimum.AAC.1
MENMGGELNFPVGEGLTKGLMAVWSPYTVLYCTVLYCTCSRWSSAAARRCSSSSRRLFSRSACAHITSK